MSTAKQLDERHYAAIKLLLAGSQRKEIAEQLNVHPTLIWQWSQMPAFQSEITRLRDEIADQNRNLVSAMLTQQAPESLARVVALRDGAKSERVQLGASQDLLDRAGFAAVQKHEHKVEVTINIETAQLIRQVIDEENIVDVTPNVTGGKAPANAERTETVDEGEGLKQLILL